MNEKKLAAAFKALGDENRLRILDQLRGGEKCACRLLETLNVSQPTLSHHMKVLCDSGIVEGRKEGKWMYYSISQAGSQKVADALMRLTTVAVDAKRDSCCNE